ncbi:MAG: LuxR family transcriptional regulator [Bryobacterales bacterium]|nr:LuxR family transcriptional regulator [Bryobacterales bacterium]
MIRVSVAAASPIVRAGLEAVVRSRSAFDFAGALSLADLEARPDETAADVILLELPQLDEDWIGLFAGLSVPVVLLTQAPEMSLAISALRSGVRALLAADANPSEIAAAIASAALGLITVQQSGVEFLGVEPRPTLAALEEPLSPREREVLTMLAEGLSNKVLAYRLGISEHTVKFHITSIMGKLRANSRTDAVMQGIRRGLILI